MIDRIALRYPNAVLSRRQYPQVGLMIGLVTLALSWTPLGGEMLARVALFYLAVACAYGLMPLARRGDIPLVAAWVVLISELAPCALGHMLSPAHVAADSAGVIMAAAPIYIARLRQIRQGDLGSAQKRAMQRRIADADFGRAWAPADPVGVSG